MSALRLFLDDPDARDGLWAAADAELRQMSHDAAMFQHYRHEYAALQQRLDFERSMLRGGRRRLRNKLRRAEIERDRAVRQTRILTDEARSALQGKP